jgi:hypothetical protein
MGFIVTFSYVNILLDHIHALLSSLIHHPSPLYPIPLS